MSIRTRILHSAAVLLLALPLAGCYISSSENIAGDFGERIDLASKLWCTSEQNGDTSLFAVNEVRGNTVPNKFKYSLAVADGSSMELVFRDLEKPGVYMVQAEFPTDAEVPTYYFGNYVEETRTFHFFGDNVSDIIALAKSHKVMIDGGVISGSYTNIRSFFSVVYTEHTADVQLTCIGIA